MNGLQNRSLIKFKQNIFLKKLLIYNVQVKFAKEFLEIRDKQINIEIKSNPDKREVNKEIIKKLAKYFGVSTAVVHIKSGHKSQQKIIEIIQ